MAELEKLSTNNLEELDKKLRVYLRKRHSIGKSLLVNRLRYEFTIQPIWRTRDIAEKLGSEGFKYTKILNGLHYMLKKTEELEHLHWGAYKAKALYSIGQPVEDDDAA